MCSNLNLRTYYDDYNDPQNDHTSQTQRPRTQKCCGNAHLWSCNYAVDFDNAEPQRVNHAHFDNSPNSLFDYGSGYQPDIYLSHHSHSDWNAFFDHITQSVDWCLYFVHELEINPLMIHSLHVYVVMDEVNIYAFVCVFFELEVEMFLGLLSLYVLVEAVI